MGDFNIEVKDGKAILSRKSKDVKPAKVSAKTSEPEQPKAAPKS